MSGDRYEGKGTDGFLDRSFLFDFGLFQRIPHENHSSNLH